MKVLQDVKPTPEQLPLLLDQSEGVLVISGAAGSGKTTVALLRLKTLVGRWFRRVVEREERTLRVLVMTYNNTLKGYIEELAKQHCAIREGVSVDVATFYDWAVALRGKPSLVSPARMKAKLVQLSSRLDLPSTFVQTELDYVLGRFLPGDLENYILIRRRGRGASPRMQKSRRRQFLDEVVYPYIAWKADENVIDFSDIGIDLAVAPATERYDIVVVDEAQDFEANRIRAVLAHLHSKASVTFILDRAQQIYPHYFNWTEVGLRIQPSQSRRLGVNYRNTREIAEFAAPIINGLELGPDACMPDFSKCTRHGPVPNVLVGLMNQQLSWALQFISTEVDLERESVVFLHPKDWFSEHKKVLHKAGMPFETLTRRKDWPTTDTNIALCTMHSSKGLEFDHVLLLGLSQIATPNGDQEGDGRQESQRRLLAMAIGRARMTMTIGYKRGEESNLVDFFAPGTFTTVEL